MTIRGIINSILDHPIQFEPPDPWAVAAGAAIAVVLIIAVHLWLWRKHDGDNGWYI